MYKYKFLKKEPPTSGGFVFIDSDKTEADTSFAVRRRQSDAKKRYPRRFSFFIKSDKMKNMENTITIKTTPKDFFMHLLGFAALYASIVSFLALVFAYIDVTFPDPLSFYYTGSLSQIRLSSSVLLIIFPVFILISWLIARDFAQEPEKRNIKFRKWLIYFTLFVAAITVIVDLITLIFNFYSGELTTRFLLKTLAVLVVALSVFYYYFKDIKQPSSRKSKAVAWLASAVVLTVIIAGFFLVGTPAQQRERKFDEQRINDLQSLQYQIVNYWQNKGKLPADLDLLTDSISGFVAPTDPQTQNSYGYAVKGSLEFELCTNFKTDSNKTSSGRYMPKDMSTAVRAYPYPYQENWEHGVGKTCFERTIDPELYQIKIK
ncbi:MAG: hypothetical protein HYT63_00525 [Candidatus Yanofskybacteria bacterium]|nr:hypothetical protein [Candidatus Yanofskybacteria bacterium]